MISLIKITYLWIPIPFSCFVAKEAEHKVVVHICLSVWQPSIWTPMRLSKSQRCYLVYKIDAGFPAWCLLSWLSLHNLRLPIRWTYQAWLSSIFSRSQIQKRWFWQSRLVSCAANGGNSICKCPMFHLLSLVVQVEAFSSNVLFSSQGRQHNFKHYYCLNIPRCGPSFWVIYELPNIL